MIDRATVSAWLDKYVRAWQSYDPQQIGERFTEDASYYPGPFEPPIRGRDAVVSAWLENPDPPGSFEARYEPVAVEGDVAAASGRTIYFGEDRSAIKAEYSNAFLLRFDENGRCAEYREWYMKKPDGKG